MEGNNKSVFQNSEPFVVRMDYKRNGEYLGADQPGQEGTDRDHGRGKGIPGGMPVL